MNKIRLRIFQLLCFLAFLTVALRLFYWQVLSSSKLEALAQGQYNSQVEIPVSRGKILASDGFPLVSNQPSYLAYLYRPDLEIEPAQAAQQLAPLLLTLPKEVEATITAQLKDDFINRLEDELTGKIAQSNSSWLPIKRNLPLPVKEQVQALNIKGIGFEEHPIRFYPEASMAAQLLGFVGSDGTGKPKGYFGLEGEYDLELRGKPGAMRRETDASGRPIIIGNFQNVEGRDGRTLKTHIDRGLQHLVETHLKKGMELYGAAAGEVVVMDPKTGAIKAMAAFPSYDPDKYKEFDTAAYKMPAIADSYEPGSTFKVLVMAAALNEGLINPDTVCNEPCAGPVSIGKYQIRTWNNEYNPGQTMTQVLERSDNTGMIFVAQKLGKDRFIQYLDKFGIGEPTNIDLEGETVPKLRERWGDIDLATGSFGQGLAVTTIQMVSAISAIANEGKRMEPHVVDQVIDGSKTLEIKPKIVDQPITKKTAALITQMMTASAQHGEAQWAWIKGYEFAGKTGTAQIPIAGHYDKDKTIASFVGFAPASNPRFAMIVKLKEPQSSPWASETAAPLWFAIGRDIFTYFAIPTK